MPCVYYTADEQRNMLSAELGEVRAELKKAAEELNKATRLLCRVCKKLGNGHSLEDHGQVSGLITWWKKHQEMDKNR